MSTSHADEAAVTFGAREFFKKQKHSDYALTNQMTFLPLLRILFV